MRRSSTSHLVALRLLLWLALLLAIVAWAQALFVNHRARVRGLPEGFPAPIAGADVPLLGVNVALQQFDEAELEAALTRIGRAGFAWVRQPFYWQQIEPEPGDFDGTVPDRILAALARHPELRPVVVLDADPAVPPADPERFTAFAGRFAARYGEWVDHYQIWDEPNLADRWGGGPVNAFAYADLLARSACAIRAADPGARILLAGLAPTVETGPQNLSDVRYLEQLYQAGAAPFFDVVAGKPYGFYTGPDDRRVDETVLNFSRLILLREVMVEHGDGGEALWASHWGWNALPPDWAGEPSLWGQTDEETQAAYTVAALERARAEWPWVGAMFLDHFRPAAALDDPRWGFALVDPDGDPRPVYGAVAAWAAALPNAAPVGGYPARNPWATYAADWRVGPLGADIGAAGGPATFHFDGSGVALTVRRGPYRAFLHVTVDGRPPQDLPRDEAGRAYVVLYDSQPTVATVPLATDLPPGPHTVEIVPAGGHGQWALVDWRVGAAPVGRGYAWRMAGLIAAGLLCVALLVREARRVDWRALARTQCPGPPWVLEALAVGLTVLLWGAAGAAWGRDWSSPWLIISLAALPPLAALFALRPDLGLALVALTAPFYLQPAGLFYGALSLPELLVVLGGIGVVGRRMSARKKAKEKETRVDGSARRRLSLVDWGVGLLILAAAAAAGAAGDKRAALFELRAVFVLPALYYALLRLVHLDAPARWRLVDGLVLGGVGVALVGLVQYGLGRNVVLAEGGLPRLRSVYPSPNGVGLYLGRLWPLLVAVALWGRSAQGEGRRRVLYALALVPVTLALALSFSRGALLLALPAALLVMGWRAGGRWRRGALALVAVAALALIPLLRLPRFASLLDLRRGSTFFRLELWRSSLAMIARHPWFGVGPGNFLEAYRTRYVLPSAWQEFNLEHPHNIYLDHWTRLGLPGLLAGALVQVAFWRRLSGRQGAGERGLRLGLAGSMAALLAHGLVDNALFFPDLALAFFLTLGFRSGTESNRTTARSAP